ncbi:peroxiredoxin [Desulfoplanes sp. PS50]
MKRCACLVCLILIIGGVQGWAAQYTEQPMYRTGHLKPLDSVLKVKVGDMAPDFILPAIDGTRVSLSDYRGKKHVMLSFVPAAFTPVCSDQWPGYDLIRDVFEAHNTILLGISTDNVPSLYAWTQAMGGLWFKVLSDFWPHGQVATTYGVLRSDGTAERAIFIIDSKGIIRYIDVQDINFRPKLKPIIESLEKLK